MNAKQVRIGESVTNEEILGFAKLFNDELTLDNISRCNFAFVMIHIIEGPLSHAVVQMIGQGL